MAKKGNAPLGSFGHFDYEPDYDPNDTIVYGRGRETAGALEDRNDPPGPTQTVEGYRPGPLHCNRSNIPLDGGKRQLRAPSLEEGLSFSERMRSDLDDDIAGW